MKTQDLIEQVLKEVFCVSSIAGYISRFIIGENCLASLLLYAKSAVLNCDSFFFQKVQALLQIADKAGTDEVATG